MSQLPTRSLRLRSYTTVDLDRLTGEKGEIFYDYEKKTLKVYNGAGLAASSLAVFEGSGRLALGTSSGAVYANQTTGMITIGDYISTSGQPQAPSTVVQIGGAANAFAISAYGPPSVGWQFGRNGALTIPGDIRSNSNINIEINLSDSTLQRWQFGEDGALTFPDGTSQTTAYTSGGTVFTNLIDSLDSSVITVTPTVIFSSNVTIDNELTVGTGIIKNAEATWRLNGISLELPEYGLINSRTAVTIQAYDVDQSGGAANGSGSGFYAEVFAMVYGYDDVVIRANNNGTNKDWTFGANGNLTLPAGGNILNSSGQPYVNGLTSISSSVSTGIFSDASGDYQYGTLDYSYAVNGNAGQFSIEYSRPLVGGNVDINVGNTIVNGDLTLSGDIKSNGNINIDINLSDSTLRRWQFGEDGNLTFPDGTNQSSAGVALPVCVINSSTTGSNIGEVSVNFTVTNPSGAAITAIGIYVPSVNTSNAAQDVGNTNTGTQAKTLTALTGNTRYWAQVYAVTANGTAYSAPNYLSVTSICLLAGTMIALADGTYKAIEDITYTDRMLSWDFDRGCYAETTALWIKQAETGSQYNLLTFSDGTTLRTFDQHRIFNKQAGAFTYPMTAATPIGTITVNEHGDEITLIGKQVVVDTIEYYNVITDHHMNLFSDTILTSCRFNNIYPILDMKFVKDSRMLRTRDEFENIPDRFFYGLRLAEQTYELDMIEWYVTRLLSVEQSFELAAV